ncbi:MAG: hypothetical protein QM731_14945 [Chitinophagaceae bacterium]
MKHLLFTCLLAGYGHLFAQNISLKDLQQALHTSNKEQLESLLSSKGFNGGNNIVEVSNSPAKLSFNQVWYFKADKNPDGSIVSEISKNADSSKPLVKFATSNPWFYASLMNQLTESGFQYNQTIAGEKNAIISFTSSNEELLVVITDQLTLRNFQFTLRKLSGKEPKTRLRS